MKKGLFYTLLFLLVFFNKKIELQAAEQRLFTANIQWPVHLQNTPSIRAYHMGKKIPTEVHEDAHRVSFSINVPANRTILYLIVTPQIEFACQDNVVKCLTLCPRQAHRVYVLELIAPENALDPQSKRFSLTSIDQTTPHWQVKEMIAPISNARIPDESLIVCLDPYWIQSVEGGNIVELPKITIRNDIVRIAGSQDKVQEEAAKWLIAAINTDTIHGTLDKEVHIGLQPKTTVAFTL